MNSLVIPVCRQCGTSSSDDLVFREREIVVCKHCYAVYSKETMRIPIKFKIEHRQLAIVISS